MSSSSNGIQKTFTVPVSVTKGTLIDFETTGIPGVTATSEIVTLGYLKGSEAVVIQRKTSEKETFYREARSTLAKLPRPFYTYNSDFERDIMKVELRLDLAKTDFVDLMEPWRAKAEESFEKWPKLDELISEPEDYFGEPKVTGEKVPELWKLFLDGDAKEEVLDLIIDHCFSDLLREAYLLLRYPYYKDK